VRSVRPYRHHYCISNRTVPSLQKRYRMVDCANADNCTTINVDRFRHDGSRWVPERYLGAFLMHPSARYGMPSSLPYGSRAFWPVYADTDGHSRMDAAPAASKCADGGAASQYIRGYYIRVPSISLIVPLCVCAISVL